MKKIISVLLITLGISIIALQYNLETNQSLHPSSLSPALTPLEKNIQNDLVELKATHQLPPEWNDIGIITLGASNQNDPTLPNLTHSKIPTRNNGRFKLVYTPIPEDPKTNTSRLLIQFELFEIATQNKIWEQVRIYNR